MIILVKHSRLSNDFLELLNICDLYFRYGELSVRSDFVAIMEDEFITQLKLTTILEFSAFYIINIKRQREFRRLKIEQAENVFTLERIRKFCVDFQG